MKRRTIRVIIVLAAILFVGMIGSQIAWISKAYNLQEKQFDHDVSQALINVAHQILIHRGDSISFYDPVKTIEPNLFVVHISDTLYPLYLESLLKSELKQQEINIDFEYSIYDCFTDSVVYTSPSSTLDNPEEKTNVSPIAIEWQNDGHYFGVYFPNMQEIGRAHV